MAVVGLRLPSWSLSKYLLSGYPCFVFNLVCTLASVCVCARVCVPQVADFGMSRALDIQSRIQTRTYGTITHQPPETLLQGMVSRETDTYSLGVLLWQMYTGTRPWAGMTHAQVSYQSRRSDMLPYRLSQRLPHSKVSVCDVSLRHASVPRTAGGRAFCACHQDAHLAVFVAPM